jgi:hypothetical protein
MMLCIQHKYIEMCNHQEEVVEVAVAEAVFRNL